MKFKEIERQNMFINFSKPTCPRCGSTEFTQHSNRYAPPLYRCRDCGVKYRKKYKLLQLIMTLAFILPLFLCIEHWPFAVLAVVLYALGTYVYNRLPYVESMW